MSENFLSDENIQKMAEAYSQDALNFAKQNRLTLDWSDSSIETIEAILDSLHKQIGKVKPTEEQISGFSEMFGSYIGETFRKNHGAKWGIVTLNGESVPGLKSDGKASLFWPWIRVRNRLVDGPENNVYDYYLALLQQNNGGVSVDIQKASSKSQKKPFWKKLFGA